MKLTVYFESENDKNIGEVKKLLSWHVNAPFIESKPICTRLGVSISFEFEEYHVGIRSVCVICNYINLVYKLGV